MSAIIVSYRTPELTLRAATSALGADADIEVVVADNDSGDGTVEALNALQERRLRIEARPSNGGFGVAANLAASRSFGEYLVFLNSDAELSPDGVRHLVAEASAHGGRCVVGPRLIGISGEVQPSAGLRPGPLDLTVRALGLHTLRRRLAAVPLVGSLVPGSRMAREYASAETATKTIDTNMVSGACFAIGRNAFRELGGFDERFFMYFEDADLCRRAAAAGMPIRYVPSAVVTHIGGGSSSEDYHFGPLHARAMRQYLGKWYGPAGSVFALMLLVIRAMGMTLTLQRGAPRARRAFWAALRDEDPRR